MEYYTTIGIDVSDRTSKICVMTKLGGGRRIVEEATVPTTREGLGDYLSRRDRSWPVVFETGTHCRWMKALVEEMGFRAVVANPFKLKQITQSNTKNDRNDARELARLALADMELLHPIGLRAEPYQQMLRTLKARELLVKERTMIVNQIRGFAKSMGFRLPKCSASRFHRLDKSGWPADFEELTFPLFDVLGTVEEKIGAYDAQIARAAETEPFKWMVDRARLVYGVGTICACALVAAIGGDPRRFRKARDVGPYLGLVPGQDQSGQIERQKHITGAGSAFLRAVLTQSAKVAKKESAPDSDMKLRGVRISSRGGKAARNKATIAVARGLAVTVVALLKHPEREYRPLSDASKAEFERIRAEELRVIDEKVSRTA